MRRTCCGTRLLGQGNTKVGPEAWVRHGDTRASSRESLLTSPPNIIQPPQLDSLAVRLHAGYQEGQRLGSTYPSTPTELLSTSLWPDDPGNE